MDLPPDLANLLIPLSYTNTVQRAIQASQKLDAAQYSFQLSEEFVNEFERTVEGLLKETQPASSCMVPWPGQDVLLQRLPLLASVADVSRLRGAGRVIYWPRYAQEFLTAVQRHTSQSLDGGYSIAEPWRNMQGNEDASFGSRQPRRLDTKARTNHSGHSVGAVSVAIQDPGDGWYCKKPRAMKVQQDITAALSSAEPKSPCEMGDHPKTVHDLHTAFSSPVNDHNHSPPIASPANPRKTPAWLGSPSSPMQLRTLETDGSPYSRSSVEDLYEPPRPLPGSRSACSSTEDSPQFANGSSSALKDGKDWDAMTPSALYDNLKYHINSIFIDSVPNLVQTRVELCKLLGNNIHRLVAFKAPEKDDPLAQLLQWIGTPFEQRRPFDEIAQLFLPRRVGLPPGGKWWTLKEFDAVPMERTLRGERRKRTDSDNLSPAKAKKVRIASPAPLSGDQSSDQSVEEVKPQEELLTIEGQLARGTWVKVLALVGPDRYSKCKTFNENRCLKDRAGGACLSCRSRHTSCNTLLPPLTQRGSEPGTTQTANKPTARAVNSKADPAGSGCATLHQDVTKAA